MPLPYNPIVRTFCSLRAVLVSTLGVERQLICPAIPLDALIPVERRREVLHRLREAGFRVADLERHVQEWPLCNLMPFVLALAFIVPVFLQSWLAALVALAVLFVYGWLACTITRERVVQVPMGPRTVGEMVIYLTRFSEHQGYRFSRNEIALKVRFLVADHLGIPVDQVREESSFIDLDAG